MPPKLPKSKPRSALLLPLHWARWRAFCLLPSYRDPHIEAQSRSIRLPPPYICRSFSGSYNLLKKKDRPSKQTLHNREEESKRTITDAASKSEAASNDPYDFTDLNTSIDSTLDKLKNELSNLRAGGRFNHELIEQLRVEVKSSGANARGGKENLRLGDLAQVVPRSGRSVVVLVGEEDHAKPVSAAILSSPYSLNPTPNPHSPLELQLPIPPPTQESRKQVLVQASSYGEKAGHAIRQIRGKQQKRLRAMQLSRKVRPDDWKMAHDRMEKTVGEASEKVKEVVERAKKALEG